MNITKAKMDDFTILNLIDEHISEKELMKSINDKRINLLYKGDILIGILRYNLFWDNTPFINFIYIKEEYRHQQFGTKLLENFEYEMKNKGYDIILTSSLSNENGQNFFRKNGYIDCGSLILPNDVSELLFNKII